MNTAIGIGGLVSMIVIHEMGHVIAMRQCGIKIDAFGIGWHVGFLPTLTLPTGRWFGFPIKIHPLLLGAYVKPAKGQEERIHRLSYGQQSLINAGGIWANILMGMILIVILDAVYAPGSLSGARPTLALIGVIWMSLFRGFFSRYITLLIGTITLILVTVSVIKSGGQDLSGPVGIVRGIKKQSSTLSDALYWAPTFGFMLGIFNSLPVYPLDGGKIVESIFQKYNWKRALAIHQVSGIVIVLVIILWTTGNDLFQWLWK